MRCLLEIRGERAVKILPNRFRLLEGNSRAASPTEGIDPERAYSAKEIRELRKSRAR